MTRSRVIVALFVVLGLGLGWMLGEMVLSGDETPVLATELDTSDAEIGDSDQAVVREASEQTGSQGQSGQEQPAPKPEQPQPEPEDPEDADEDADDDGVDDDSDNCPATSNADQLNFDGDSKGDACDADDDNDGLADNSEQSYGTNPFKKDTDGDGWWDGTEVKQGYDPLDASSHPIIIIKN